MHRTKPQTAAAGLTDSPAGLAAWIVEKLRAWLDRTANTVRVTELPRGGHFAPFEEPELYAQELRDFFRPYHQPPTP
jgi:pimeloyl-ACP methyl ester carboxylesterase